MQKLSVDLATATDELRMLMDTTSIPGSSPDPDDPTRILSTPKSLDSITQLLNTIATSEAEVNSALQTREIIIPTRHPKEIVLGDQ